MARGSASLNPSNGFCGPRVPIPSPSIKKSRTEAHSVPMLFVAQNSAGAILVQLVVEGLETDLQQFRGARFVISSLVQRAQNHLPLDLFQRSADWKRRGIFVAQLLSLIERVRRKVMTLNLFPGTDDHGAFDHVPQFANIPRPRVIAKRVQ